MFAGRKTFIRATLVMVGTIIGAGIFGVPAMLGRAGILAGSIIFWCIAGLVLATHLLFVEIIARIKERKRLPGYLEHVFGAWAKWPSAVAHTAQIAGGSFLYIILGGEFLRLLAFGFGFDGGSLGFQLFFWFLSSCIVASALRFMAKIEAYLTWALVGLLILMLALAVPQADFSRFAWQNWGSSFGALGVFLFSLVGLSVIPEVFEIAQRKITTTRWAVILGSLASALVTWLFGIFIYAAIRNGSSADFTVMANIFPAFLWLILPVVGFLAVITSFITGAFDLKVMYLVDLKQSKLMSWGAALGLPLALLFILPRNFLSGVETMGALVSASSALLVVIAAFLVMRRDKKRVSIWWRCAAPALAAALFSFIFLQRIILFFL
jgi:amino acid permease